MTSVISLIAHMQIKINLPVAGPTSRHSTTYTHSRVPSRTGAHSSLTCDVDVRVATHSPGRSGGVNSNGTISEDTNSTGDFFRDLAFGFWLFRDCVDSRFARLGGRREELGGLR